MQPWGDRGRREGGRTRGPASPPVLDRERGGVWTPGTGCRWTRARVPVGAQRRRSSHLLGKGGRLEKVPGRATLEPGPRGHVRHSSGHRLLEAFRMRKPPSQPQQKWCPRRLRHVPSMLVGCLRALGPFSSHPAALSVTIRAPRTGCGPTPPTPPSQAQGSRRHVASTRGPGAPVSRAVARGAGLRLLCVGTPGRPPGLFSEYWADALSFLGPSPPWVMHAGL